MPSGTVDDENGMSSRCYQQRDFVQMVLHGLCVASGQNKACADAALGTDGPENPG